MRKIGSTYSKKAGLPPGDLVYTGEIDLKETEILFISYNMDNFLKKQVKSLDEIIIDHSCVNWIIFSGIPNAEEMRLIGEKYELHKLTLEDILNTSQRTKFEVYGKYKYLVTRIIHQEDPKKPLESEQLSILLKNNILITFFEQDIHIIEHLLDRISNKKGSIREKGLDYLFYALLDSIIDHYFEIISHIEDEIEKYDSKLFSEIENEEIVRVKQIRQILVVLRKNIGPFKEIFHKFSRDEYEFIEKRNLLYIHDLYDHTVHLIETIDVLKDNTSNIAEIHLSVMGNNMNEIMKVLTIISTIFIPLSFVAGLYGMNFENMPELKWNFGYFYVLIVMGLILTSMVMFFRRKKWI
ncbi:magnesium and cobalt transport protein CorA [Methanococcus maripaludis C5]|uniref:Magnesium transport protein CorA n=1 Tax=Methanococcus maripaludis (strain C5 / ATCC BAA-1333) TaxID=402880 RepID=A4FY89_METM5|nr:magnesium/cobalt transporter CorA [Methanococcus maripaludis]ABO35173.1 magnesium and cobalt transport protein CorA [Methanococcus maripaludis C5]